MYDYLFSLTIYQIPLTIDGLAGASHSNNAKMTK